MYVLNVIDITTVPQIIGLNSKINEAKKASPLFSDIDSWFMNSLYTKCHVPN